jgi:hypothetical protein
MSNYQNNQGQGFNNHEDSMAMLNSGKIHVRPGQQEIQQRIQKFGQGGQGSTNPGYTNNVGGESTQYNGSQGYAGGGASGSNYNSGQSGSMSQQFGMSQQDGMTSGGIQSGASVGGQSNRPSGHQNGIPQLSYEQLNNEYLARFPRAYGVPVVAVRKGGRGVIEAFQLQNGQVLDYADMIQAAFDRQLQGIEVQNNREGELILRSSPDGFRSNNLDQLPGF